MIVYFVQPCGSVCQFGKGWQYIGHQKQANSNRLTLQNKNANTYFTEVVVPRLRHRPSDLPAPACSCHFVVLLFLPFVYFVCYCMGVGVDCTIYLILF